MTSEQSNDPRKAYEVIEASKGETVHMVYANSIREIRENWPDVEREGVEHYSHPAGLRQIRRMPSDDR